MSGVEIKSRGLSVKVKTVIVQKSIILVLLAAARDGKLTRDHLSSKDVFAKHLMRSLVNREFLRQTKVYVGLHAEFIEMSEKSWRKGDKELALVLLATGIEQAINHYYRLILEGTSLSGEEITTAIKTHSLDAKMGWFLKLVTGGKISDRLSKKIKNISAIRNAIVHYKAEGTLMDEQTGSHDVIHGQIKALGRLSVGRLMAHLESELWEITRKHDKNFSLAMEAVGKMGDWKMFGFES